jgi:hypothetical protein
VVLLAVEGAAEKYMPQLQHNMWVVAAKSAVLSIIIGGGKWVEITAYADPLYQHLIVTAERKFWRCVESGDTIVRSTAAGMKPHGGLRLGSIREPLPANCGVARSRRVAHGDDVTIGSSLPCNPSMAVAWLATKITRSPAIP